MKKLPIYLILISLLGCGEARVIIDDPEKFVKDACITFVKDGHEQFVSDYLFSFDATGDQGPQWSCFPVDYAAQERLEEPGDLVLPNENPIMCMTINDFSLLIFLIVKTCFSVNFER